MKNKTVIIFAFLVLSTQCYSGMKSCLLANSKIDPKAPEICDDALSTPGMSVDDKSIIHVTYAAYLIAINKFNEANKSLDIAFNINPKMLENGKFRYNWLRTKGVLYFSKDRVHKSITLFY